MSTNRTPTPLAQLLTAGQMADVEHACGILGIDPNKKVSEWRIDSMGTSKKETDLFIRNELEKLIREAQGRDKEGGGATASGPSGSATWKQENPLPTDSLMRLKGVLHEVDQYVAAKQLECAEMALERAEAVVNDLMKVLDRNVKDKLMEADEAYEISGEAAVLMRIPREAVNLLKKRVAAQEKEAAENEAFHDAHD